MKLWKLIVIVIILALLAFVVADDSYLVVYKEKLINATLKDNSKNLYKNKLMDVVLDELQNKFNSSSYTLTEFKTQKNDSNVYIFSQILEFNEAYILIQYSGLDITSINIDFNNVKKEQLNDILEIISIIISISDSSIFHAESRKIATNMFKQFETGEDSVTLVYPNSLIYSLSIINNNGLRFSIK